MSLSAAVFGRNSLIFKVGNVLGLGIPGYLDKRFGIPDTEAQLGEIAQQTAKEGEPRPIIWGRVRPIGGNIIHCAPPEVVRKKQKSGKGGGGAQGETQTIFRTYAIRISEGPVTGVIRAWRNNKLVYDARGNDWGTVNNGIYLQSARFFLGNYDQMPSADLEAVWGAGQVSAYRGTCYVVMVREDVTDCGGAVPQWQFEVERSEYIPLTSRPYPLEMEIEGYGVEAATRSANLKSLLITEPPEADRIAATVQSFDLRQLFKTYTEPTESERINCTINSIDLRQTLKNTAMNNESDRINCTVSSFALEVKLISTTIPTESDRINATVQSINLGP